MSHYIDTKQTHHWGARRLSGRQLLEIVTGVAVVVALVIAAFAYVNTAEPIASSGTAERTEPLTMVTHGALDPFEAQYVSPRLQAAIGTDTEPLTMVTHGALDPFETQFVSPLNGLDAGAPADSIDQGSPNPMPEFR